MGVEVFHALKQTLHDQGLATAVGDEGGFAPDLDSNEEALKGSDGHRGGRPTRRATTSRSRSTRPPARSSRTAPTSSSTRAARCRSSEMVDYWADIAARYPIVSIEDGSTRTTGTAGRLLTEQLGDRVQLVGDDLFVTNTERLARGIESRRRQLDPDQGQPDRHAHRDARRRSDGRARPATRAVMSHRSGETEDTTIADLAVATDCGQIKTGAPVRSDRVAKYNQLLRIEEELGADAAYGKVLHHVGVLPHADHPEPPRLAFERPRVRAARAGGAEAVRPLRCELAQLLLPPLVRCPTAAASALAGER